MMQQNIFLALAFAALNGICNTLSAVILVVQDEKTKNSQTSGTTTKHVALALNLLVQGMAIGFGTVSTWFGPASLYAPTSLSAQLLSNILIIGYLMKRENVNKETQVATAVILISVLVFPYVGPSAQNEENILSILRQPSSLTMFALLLSVLVISTIIMVLKDLKEMKQFHAEACLMAVATSSGVLTPSLSRVFSIIEAGPLRTSIIAIYILTMLIWTAQSIYEAHVVEIRTRYVPTYLCSTIILNAIAGLLIWNDWRFVVPFPYACILIQMMLGVYLMSDLNHFEVVSKQTRSALQRQASTVRRDLNAGISSLPDRFGTPSFHGHLPHVHIRQTKVSFVDDKLTRGQHLSNTILESACSNSFEGRQLRHCSSLRSIQINKPATVTEGKVQQDGIGEETATGRHYSFVY